MADIKKEMINGVFWSAIEKYSSLVVSIIISMILARLLSPQEYGVVAIATVIINFLQIFCTMGIGPAVIQRNDLTQQDINSIFTFSLCLGLILSVLLFAFSVPIANFYKEIQLVPICRILSVQLLFASANMVPNALMAKDKRFKDIAKRTFILQLSSGILSVIAAWNGAGVYSLLISPIISSIGIFLWNRMYYKICIDWSFDIHPIKKIISFSSYQFLFEFVNYFSRNLDKLIIGRHMTVDALGYYEKSYRLMQLPLQNVTAVINPVLQPVLKVLQDDKNDLSLKYNKIVRVVATLSFPIGIILSGMATEVIQFFYGNNWDAAIPVFRILSLSLPLQMILSTTGSIYMVCNNTKMQFWLGVRNTITTVAGFLIAALLFKTIEAVAWAWTITLFINFVCTYLLMYRYVLRVSIIPMLKELLHPFICSILLGLFFYFCRNVQWPENLLITIFLKGGMSILIAIVYIQVSGQYNFIKLIISVR